MRLDFADFGFFVFQLWVYGLGFAATVFSLICFFPSPSHRGSWMFCYLVRYMNFQLGLGRDRYNRTSCCTKASLLASFDRFVRRRLASIWSGSSRMEVRLPTPYEGPAVLSSSGGLSRLSFLLWLRLHGRGNRLFCENSWILRWCSFYRSPFGCVSMSIRNLAFLRNQSNLIRAAYHIIYKD